MKFNELMRMYGSQPVIETEALLVGLAAPQQVRVQISRWHRAGKIIQLRKGLYAFSKTYRKVEIFELYLAAVLHPPSYLSLEKAL